MNRKIFFPLALGLLAVLFACKQKASATQSATGFANETDYVCGMKVQADYTDTCHYKGKVYVFCGESCKEEFQASPESFLNKPANQ
ncbi:MAG TPA: YHS domain-containing protein [Saprospiraceae bacterium]|nr:YHS domain-containing protein [Saprospiraceae bacterium]HMQ81423.1 YHS domain-containing protein [Saprospiraceae bacterium]